MLFSRNAAGMEITENGLVFAKVSGTKAGPILNSSVTVPYPADTVRFSLKEPAIINPEAFRAALREGHNRLLSGTRRIAVSLPDTAGRTVILDMETRLKSHAEGVELIRWKLKKSFPFDISESHIDYQLLQTKDTGEISVLVGIIAKPIICQIEDILVAGGLEPNRIEFSSFSLFRLFSSRLDLTDYAAYISLYRETVSVFIFNNGALEFFRSKEFHDASPDINWVYREINSSFLVYANRKPGQQLQKVFFSATPPLREAMRGVIAEISGFEPFYLEHDKAVGGLAGVGQAYGVDAGQLLAAAGAAMGNI